MALRPATSVDELVQCHPIMLVLFSQEFQMDVSTNFPSYSLEVASLSETSQVTHERISTVCALSSDSFLRPTILKRILVVDVINHLLLRC